MKKKKGKKTAVVQKKSLENLRAAEYFGLSLIIVIILGFLVYSNTFDNEPVFDDTFWMNQSEFKGLDDIGGIMELNKFRFIPFLSFAVNYTIHGQETGGFHLLNLLLHIANSMLVILLLRMIFSTPAMKENRLAGYKNTIALLCGLIFLLHPLQTQAVAYIYQRITSIVSFFYLVTVCLYLAGRLSGLLWKKILMVSLAMLSMILAFLSKENSFTLPMMLILIELMFLNKSFRFKFKYLIAVFGIFGIGAFIVFYSGVYTKIFRVYYSYTGEIIHNLNYFITQFTVMLTYFRLLIFPVGQNVDHDFHVIESFTAPTTLIGIGAIVLLVGFGIYFLRKNRLVSFGIFWFFITIAIESSFIPILDLMMEHRLYLPIAGFAVFLTGIIFHFFPAKYIRQVLAAFAILLAVFALMSHLRNDVWQNSFTLWSDAIEKAPKKARPYNGRGLVYYRQGNFDKALEDFNKALEINPDFTLALQNRGNLYQKREEYEKAIEDFTKITKIDKYNRSVYNNRANSYYKTGQYQKAIADYIFFLKVYDDFAPGYINLGNCYMELQKYQAAINNYRKAIEVDKPKPDYYNKIGDTYFLWKKYKRAIEHYDSALALAPDFYKSLNNRATAWFYKGNYEKAVRDYEKTIRLKPDLIDAYKNLGLVYENLNRIDKAIDMYSEALSITPGNSMLYFYRANLYMNQRDYRKAAEDYRKVLQIDPQNKIARRRLGICQRYGV